MDVEEDMHIDSVTIKSLRLNGIRSVIFTRLETCSKYKRCRIEYRTDTGSDGHSITIGIFRGLF